MVPSECNTATSAMTIRKQAGGRRGEGRGGRAQVQQQQGGGEITSSSPGLSGLSVLPVGGAGLSANLYT